MINQLLTFLEKYSFGVCTYLGERMGISIFKIRLFFIYLFEFLGRWFSSNHLFTCRGGARH